MNFGITSQYGFLYQRIVFMHNILNNIARECIFVFEGKDDIEIAVNDQSSSIDIGQNIYIQVKSGFVDLNCFCKIVCNWLLATNSSNIQYRLILENELDFNLTIEQQIDYIYEYIIKGKGRSKNSIAYKTYTKFESYDVDVIKTAIRDMLISYQKTIISISTLENEMYDIFKKDYCSDISLYEIAIEKRLTRFIQLINDYIDAAIKNKKSCTLIYSQIISKIQKTCEEISDTKYSIDTSILKKSLLPKATELVEERKLREVQQLFLVESTSTFVIDNIVNELIYKDFRDVYSTQKDIDITNIEESAVENFRDAYFSLTDEDKQIPKKVYLATTNKSISSNYMMESPIYRKGCYIYLTGEEINNEKQITWGDDNED